MAKCTNLRSWAL